MKFLDKIATGIIGLILGTGSLAGAQSASKQPDIEKVPDIMAGTCSDEDRSQVVDAPVTASVMLHYGFDMREGIWRCTKLRAPWLKIGKVFSLQTISAQVDTGNTVTILSVKREPLLWVIPVSSGMVGYPNMPDEIHNRAAFNAILAENKVGLPSPETWISLALFYMNMVGIEIHVVDWKTHGETVHGLASSPNFFHKKSLLPAVECESAQCTVTINDTRATPVTHKLTTWVLTFTATANHAPRLDSVEHEVKLLSELP